MSGDDFPYTEVIMTEQRNMHTDMIWCQQGGNSLLQSRLALAEVQICGIPKLSQGKVAPTP